MATTATLPYTLIGDAPTEPVLTVDGAFGAPGLELSHWPGNRTPRELRHRLSTGAALKFVALDEQARAGHLEGLGAIVNNHYDTDGLCAAWALLHPERARELEQPLLATAACGDFFQLPDEASFARDVLIQALVDRQHSPLAREFEGLDDLARQRLASRFVLEHLGDWLASGLEDAPLASYRQQWEPQLERLRRDLALVDAAERRERPELDLTVFTLRGEPSADSLPGRHALFGRTTRDRVLLVSPAPTGTFLRLVVGTRSWFDLDPEEAPPARFDLVALCDSLSALEPGRGDESWRCDQGPHPSPELWFGTDAHSAFEEHHAGLAPSRLDADALLGAL